MGRFVGRFVTASVVRMGICLDVGDPRRYNLVRCGNEASSTRFGIDLFRCRCQTPNWWSFRGSYIFELQVSGFSLVVHVLCCMCALSVPMHNSVFICNMVFVRFKQCIVLAYFSQKIFSSFAGHRNALKTQNKRPKNVKSVIF